MEELVLDIHLVRQTYTLKNIQHFPNQFFIGNVSALFSKEFENFNVAGSHHSAMAAAVAAANLHPDQDTDPRELEAFAERFKQRRIKLGKYFKEKSRIHFPFFLNLYRRLN
jgi:Pou domain - N-terminal to homeobox domain